MNEFVKRIITIVGAVAGLVAVLIAVGIVFLITVVDPNDYKAQVEDAAKQGQIELKIQGDLAWQFFPRLGVSIENLSFYDQTAVPDQKTFSDQTAVPDKKSLADNKALSGTIDRLSLSIGWAELLRFAADRTQLKIGSVEVSGGQVLVRAHKSLPVQLNNIELSTSNISREGKYFPVKISASAFGGQKFSLQAKAALKATDAGLEQLALSDMILSLNQLEITGLIQASKGLTLIEGNLQSNIFDLKQQLQTIGKQFPALALPQTKNPSALKELSIKSRFNIDLKASAEINNVLTLDGQPITIDLRVDQQNNKLTTIIAADLLKAADYMPSASSNLNSKADNSGLFAPLAIPFALWQGQSQVEVNIKTIQFTDFAVDNFYSNVFGNQRVLSLTSLNADVFSGQINAIAKLDMRSSTPSFNMQPSLKGIDMALALPALADYKALKGTLSLDSNIQGAGDSMNSILESITGAGQFDIRSPSYADINVEQTFCNAAALLGSRGQSNKNWPTGTNLEDLSGSFQVSQGKLSINEYSTGTGNLSIMGRGTVALLKRTYNIRANALLDGTTSSSNGCSVNKRLQNRQIPFICRGSFDGGSTECKPDERVLKELLKNTALEALGGQLLKSRNNGSTSEEDTTDPLKSLLNDYLKRKLEE